MDMRNNNWNPNFRRKNSTNIKSNDNNNNSQKDKLKEHGKEFKEVFVKAKDPSSSHLVLEEQYFDAPDEMMKSTIICDSSYLN